MSIKILNEGFEKIFSSVKQNKELKEAYDPALKELSSVLLDLSKRIKNGKINCNLKSCADAFQNIIENMYPDKSWWEVTDVNIQNDLFDTQDPEKTALNIIKNIREKSDRKIESLKESGDSKEFKVRFYKIGGQDEGKLDHEEFFDTKEDAVEAFNKVFKKELFSLNPTVWKKQDGEWKRVMNSEMTEAKNRKSKRYIKESFPTHGNKIDLEEVIQALWEKGDEIGGEDWIEVFNPNEVSKLSSGEEYCNRIEVTGADDKQIKISLKTNGGNVEYQIFNEGRDWKKASSIDELWKVIFDRVGRKTNESLRRKPMRESEKEPEIKRYSDVRPRSERKYWYFTTHGVQPGSIPRDLNVLEVRDGQNDKGTWGTYVMLDGVLNTSELRYYDMRELAPKEETEKRRMRPQGERITAWESLKNKKKNSLLAEKGLTRAERHNRNMDRIFNNKKEQDKKFANFLKKNGYSDESIEKLRKQDKLSAEIASKFTPKGKQPSDVLGKILGESRKQKCRLKESFEEPVYSMPVSIKVRNGYLETDVSIWEDGDEYALDIGEENPVETPNKEKITSDWIQNKIPYVSWDWYDNDLDYMKHQCKKAVNAIENFFEENPLKESLKRKNKKSLKESKKLNESFDDMEVFMNTWANYNENGADSGITPTGWMSIDDAIEYCEEYADYEPFINDTDNIPFDDINEYSNASSVLQELKELQESDVDEDVVAAIVEATGYGIKEAVEIAERGDYYWYPGISSYTDLAYAVIDEIGSLKDALGDRVVNYIDEDQMRREYRWDIREIMRDTAEQEVDDAHEGEDEDSYDREQEIEDWMDEHEDEYLDMIIDEDIRMAEAGEVDLSNYFDYEAFGRDLSFDGYTIVDGGIILVN